MIPSGHDTTVVDARYCASRSVLYCGASCLSVDDVAPSLFVRGRLMAFAHVL